MKMLEILQASAKNGEVKINGQKVPGVKILSQGMDDSAGIMLLNGEDKVYIAIPIESLKQILDLLGELALQIGTNIKPSNGGGDIAPMLNTAMQNINLKTILLKDNLQ